MSLLLVPVVLCVYLMLTVALLFCCELHYTIYYTIFLVCYMHTLYAVCYTLCAHRSSPCDYVFEAHI
jgi:hypothetical protein